MEGPDWQGPRNSRGRNRQLVALRSEEAIPFLNHS